MELLMVIAIIAILAALLLSAVNAAKNKAGRIQCLNNLHQISLGVLMYSDDSNDKAPKPALWTSNPYDAYKELVKSYAGLTDKSSKQDKLFACPADTFYYDYSLGHYPRSHPLMGYVAQRVCDRPDFDYSSYVFNAGNQFGAKQNDSHQPVNRPGIAGLPLSSIKHSARTVLVTEVPALLPFSWHSPKWLVWSPKSDFFNNAMNNVSFVDGHVSFIKIYWKASWPPMLCACDYDPPSGYDYQWSGN